MEKHAVIFTVCLAIIVLLTSCGDKTGKPMGATESISQTITDVGVDVDSQTQGEDTATQETERTEETTASTGNTVYVTNIEESTMWQEEEKCALKVFEGHDIAPESDFIVKDDEYGGVMIKKYVGSSRIVIIPETIGGKTVTKLDHMAFYQNNTIIAVKIPDTVTVIREWCFVEAGMLETVVTGIGLKIIEERAFQNCPELHTVVLREGLEVVDNLAFAGCGSLLDVIIPSTAKLENNAFLNFDYEWKKKFVMHGVVGSSAEKYIKDHDLLWFKPVE